MATANTQLEAVEVQPTPYERPWLKVIRRFLHHRLAIGSIIVMVIIIALVLAVPWLTQFAFTDQSLTQKNLPPFSTYTLPDGTTTTVIMGTDELGRDLFTRLLYAGRVSLRIAFAVTILGELLGIIIGVVSGYFGGFIDTIAMRAVDFLNTLPLLPILLVLTTVLKPSINVLILVLVFFGWTGGARLMRGQILSLRELEFVSASKALGASNIRIMFRHLIPNALAPSIVNASLGLSSVMILEAALSFLGFGVQLPNPSWGNMLKDAGTLTVLDNYPWRAFFPGLAIFLCSLCFNFIGDGLRDALDPRSTR